jgi:hypothetical protein
MRWWELPGPAEFINQLILMLKDGQSVALVMPKLPEWDVGRVVLDALYERYRVLSIDVEGNEDALKVVTEAIGILPDSWGSWSVAGLMALLEGDRVIVVDRLSEANWSVWRSFMVDFEAASRSRPELERPVILCLVRGVSQKRVHQLSAPALTILPWKGVIDEFDTNLYVDRALKTNGIRRSYHSLLVKQITSIAMWDLGLADRLLQSDEDEVFDPMSLLGGINEECAALIPAEGDWESGGTDFFSGRESRHSQLLAAEGDPQGQLNMRIWAAQSAEVFPLVELRRREAAAALNRYIRTPLDINDQRIDRLEDLEIGLLRHLVRKNSRTVDRTLAARIEKLADIRNKLAHLEPLSASEAKDQSLYGAPVTAAVARSGTR